MRTLLLLTAVALLFALASTVLSQPEGMPILLILPSAEQLNLTKGEVESLVFTVSNVGSETAYNISINVIASGCVQLLNEKSVWVSNVSLTLDELKAGTARRALIPVKCLGETGTVAISAYADNADPSFTIVRVFSREEQGTFNWLIVVPLILVFAVSIGLYRRSRAKRARKTRVEKRGKRKS
ncbi:MAG: hypothetical protein NZ954_07810 [Thermofilaceae archaeon]|nr:hypothetical protein [Thermofilaceae archaeon]MDW8004745.1 hypothetical protein [Thermofilaceae archaeon]